MLHLELDAKMHKHKENEKEAKGTYEDSTYKATALMVHIHLWYKFLIF